MQTTGCTSIPTNNLLNLIYSILKKHAPESTQLESNVESPN